MQAAVLHPDHRIILSDIPEPVLSAGQTLVGPTVVGLCGSDVSYATKGANGAFVVRHPMVLGHELCARLLADTMISGTLTPEGTVVVVHPLWPSPLQGESTVRLELADQPASFLGSASTAPHTNGGLAERVAVRPEQLRVLPAGLPPERAVLAEPLAVVLHALGRLTVPIAGRRVLICGAGPIGLLMAICVKAGGAAEVSVTDLHARPLELARSLGADTGIRVPGESVRSQHFDIAIEATGATPSLATAIDALTPGGHLLQLGMLPRDPISIGLGGIVTKELNVVGSHRFAGELDPAIDFLAHHPECQQIVTHRFGLAEAGEAIRLAADAASASKVVVQIDPLIGR